MLTDFEGSGKVNSAEPSVKIFGLNRVWTAMVEYTTLQAGIINNVIQCGSQIELYVILIAYEV